MVEMTWAKMSWSLKSRALQAIIQCSAVGNRCSSVLWMVIGMLVVWVCDDDEAEDEDADTLDLTLGSIRISTRARNGELYH